MKKLILLVFLTISFNLLNAASLRVQDPQTWSSYEGKITEFTVDVTPVGIYFQYEIYITFAAQDNVYQESDSVEIIYNFSLPSEALITDSWLWVYDKPEKAYLLDVWTATSIYEGIVNRRKDPSLFRKTSPTNYSLNIYPMGGKSSRKVKITMMLPTEWQGDKIQSIFPNSMVSGLSLIPEKIKINLKKSDNWQSPLLEPYITKTNDSYNVSKDDYANYPITITYANPSSDNTFFTIYEKGTEKYYQFLISPFSTEISNTPKK
ncbi:MAG: hypothetical protein IPO21_07305 [Bacteroidales bacterium]|nr:hypothetical protein [Bacteroidales bacterium]